MLLGDLFIREGFRVDVATDGAAAITFLEHNDPPSAILLDLLMPGIGGYAVLKELRRASPNRATPVVIISVLEDKATQNRCMKAGANAYVVKPVDRSALAATVRAQIAGRAKPKARRT